jgi:dipeptidyl aminopeptidase/acylaminoacyl peptidase
VNVFGRGLQPRRGPGQGSLWSVVPGGLPAFFSLLGLVVVAALSVALLGGSLPSFPGGGDGAIRTPTPSGVVVIDPRGDVPGSLVYMKAGNIWVQSGDQAHQLTTGGADAMPAWSADGQWIYFIRYRREAGQWPVSGVIKPYDLMIPGLERIHPDGSGAAEILNGRFARGANTWSFFIRQPSISPDGKTAAVITDGPDPTRSDLVLKLITLTTGSITGLNLADVGGLGHQDPAWSPDGKTILYVKNARDGTRGAAVIIRYDVKSRKTSALTGPGYQAPAWSPDGRYVAATRTDAFGTDIVLLDAKSGAELLRVTQDESSFGPVWSPVGDSIAFFRVDRGVVDLELVRLKGSAPSWSVGDTFPLTISAGLDASSHASWFVPADQLPKPTPGATPTAATPAGPAASGG